MAYQQQMMMYQQYIQYLQYLQYLQQLQYQYHQGPEQGGRYGPYAADTTPQTYSGAYTQYYSPGGYQPPQVPPSMPQPINVVDFYRPSHRLALPSEIEEPTEETDDPSYQYETEGGGGYTVDTPAEKPQWGAPLQMDDGVTEGPISDETVMPIPARKAPRAIPVEQDEQYAPYTEVTEFPSDMAPVEDHMEEGLFEVLCFACGNPIPIYTDERPLYITCPNCGQEGEID